MQQRKRWMRCLPQKFVSLLRQQDGVCFVVTRKGKVFGSHSKQVLVKCHRCRVCPASLLQKFAQEEMIQEKVAQERKNLKLSA